MYGHKTTRARVRGSYLSIGKSEWPAPRLNIKTAQRRLEEFQITKQMFNRKHADRMNRVQSSRLSLNKMLQKQIHFFIQNSGVHLSHRASRVEWRLSSRVNLQVCFRENIAEWDATPFRWCTGALTPVQNTIMLIYTSLYNCEFHHAGRCRNYVALSHIY
jgi:hypothetical protein